MADRRLVRRLNFDGDGQADLVGHGGEHRAVYVAVYVYDLSAYDHWADFLRRDDLSPGHFGENFTVERMPDDEACVGDRYPIGDATFEVTQPRVTCYKVGLRLQERRMPALLYSHGRPGFYLRVLEEGVVGAGDAIERIAVGSEAMPAAPLDNGAAPVPRRSTRVARDRAGDHLASTPSGSAWFEVGGRSWATSTGATGRRHALRQTQCGSVDQKGLEPAHTAFLGGAVVLSDRVHPRLSPWPPMFWMRALTRRPARSSATMESRNRFVMPAEHPVSQATVTTSFRVRRD